MCTISGMIVRVLRVFMLDHGPARSNSMTRQMNPNTWPVAAVRAGRIEACLTHPWVQPHICLMLS